ncbi:metallophosphoesterase [Echinicola pacifica]|uniref:Metallophosphoesterase n=2 Tax=Echinicola pacifica TaxID=346377 RepID=A0A918PKG2_9BACT|nr:metallophosphoesterase [Echinicola pacifica]
MAQDIGIISYNIHHGADLNGKSRLGEMAEFISSQKAQLVGLQEVDSVCLRSGMVDQLQQIAKHTDMHYAFARHFAYDGGAYGLGILSSYPLENIKNDRILSIRANGEKSTLALLSAEITLSTGKKVRFATVHLALDQPTRIVQIQQIIELLGDDLPLILTGDLNTEPDTEEIKLLETKYLLTHSKDQFTFPVHSPTKKIDFILLSHSDFEQSSAPLVFDQISYSDHLPLRSTVRLKPTFP